ncbi:hypothetical protein CDL15_Pgr011240 [Punica granatum]|nr:hypothetical protein CDL15_Pgr011240 [Punica granatum]
MIHDVESWKSNHESLKSKMYHVTNMLFHTIRRDNATAVILDREEARAVMEAMVQWFSKAKEIINAGLNKLQDLLEEAQGKKSKESSELSSDLDQ